MTYKPHPTKTEGGIQEALVSDDDAQSLMSQILKELKKMNIHLELITGEEVKNTEVE